MTVAFEASNDFGKIPKTDGTSTVFVKPDKDGTHLSVWQFFADFALDLYTLF